MECYKNCYYLMDGHQNRQQTKPKCSRAGVAGLVVLQKCV